MLRISGNQIKVLRSDNGGEYCSNNFDEYLKQKGITRQLTVSNNPGQNGLAERMNHTLVESVRSMMFHSNLSVNFWAEALNTAVYLKKRSPTIRVDIIYLDFAKAFDSVCPAKLVSKLKAFGIGDPLLKWFQSYLTERKQRVVVNGTYSAWTDVGSGVPQGSLLGPILFLLYVNDMPRVVENASLAMFADDSKCFKVIYQESDFVNLQRDLDALSAWSFSNDLFFQATKCINLRISRKRNSPSRNYSLNGISLEVVKI